jgi:hypothetical protein
MVIEILVAERDAKHTHWAGVVAALCSICAIDRRSQKQYAHTVPSPDLRLAKYNNPDIQSWTLAPARANRRCGI